MRLEGVVPEKTCPILKATKHQMDNQRCFKDSCAWWDKHYNCCAVLSSAILLEVLTIRKGFRRPKENIRSRGNHEEGA